MKKIPWILLFSLLLASCGSEAFPDISLPFLATKTPTPTLTPTITNTATPTFTPTLGLGSTRLSEVDGMLQVYIPAGEFSMGSTGGAFYEKPVHAVYLDGYWMDISEVTNQMYALFLNEMGNQEEEGVLWWIEALGHTGLIFDGTTWHALEGHEQKPVVSVTWHGADSYCTWAGRRLPTEAEWEKAARGGLEGKTFPWGDAEPVCLPEALNAAQFRFCVGGLLPVMSYHPIGYGLYDMSGNAWEWVADWYDTFTYASSPYENPPGPTSGINKSRILRGGSWTDSGESLRVSYRFYYYFNATAISFGFRCAATP